MAIIEESAVCLARASLCLVGARQTRHSAVSRNRWRNSEPTGRPASLCLVAARQTRHERGSPDLEPCAGCEATVLSLDPTTTDYDFLGVVKVVV
mgnify:CR=1 FL=1